MHTASEILAILDQCTRDFSFPMLDNGYVYLAATRLGLFRSDEDWAMTIEVFGNSPRSGVPDLHVHTFASTLHDRDPAERYVSRAAYRNYLRVNPNNDSRFFQPFDVEPWVEICDGEDILPGASQVVLRGTPHALPTPDQFRSTGIELIDPPSIAAFEVCRAFAASHRDLVLGTTAERRVSVPPDMAELLVLEEWNHPDVVTGALPSASETFQQLARVLETADAGHYQPTLPPNTHWRNWPEGGSL